MKMEEIVRRVRDIAGDTGALQFSNYTLTDWINDAVAECAEQNSLLQKTASSNTVIGQQEYTLPADIFKMYSVSVNKQRIRLLTMQEYQTGSNAAFAQQGTPVAGYIWTGKLTLVPTPDAAVELRIDYVYEPVKAVYTGDPNFVAWKDFVPAIPESYHKRLVSYCLAMVAYQDDNQDRGDVLMEQFRSGVIDLSHQALEDDLYPFITVADRDSGGFEPWLT